MRKKIKERENRVNKKTHEKKSPSNKATPRDLLFWEKSCSLKGRRSVRGKEKKVKT